MKISRIYFCSESDIVVKMRRCSYMVGVQKGVPISIWYKQLAQDVWQVQWVDKLDGGTRIRETDLHPGRILPNADLLPPLELYHGDVYETAYHMSRVRPFFTAAEYMAEVELLGVRGLCRALKVPAQYDVHVGTVYSINECNGSIHIAEHIQQEQRTVRMRSIPAPAEKEPLTEMWAAFLPTVQDARNWAQLVMLRQVPKFLFDRARFEVSVRMWQMGNLFLVDGGQEESTLLAEYNAGTDRTFTESFWSFEAEPELSARMSHVLENMPVRKLRIGSTAACEQLVSKNKHFKAVFKGDVISGVSPHPQWETMYYNFIRAYQA